MNWKARPIKVIILGGIFFLLPILAAIVLFSRGIKLLFPLAQKIVHGLEISTLFGAATTLIVCLLLILFICYLSGLLLTKGFFTRWNSAIEEKLFLLFPNFQMLKYQALDDDSGLVKPSWEAILLEDNDSWSIAFITHRLGNILALYIPDAPRIDAGELRFVKATSCQYTPIKMKDAMQALINFGQAESVSKSLQAKLEKEPESGKTE